MCLYVCYEIAEFIPLEATYQIVAAHIQTIQTILEILRAVLE